MTPETKPLTMSAGLEIIYREIAKRDPWSTEASVINTIDAERAAHSITREIARELAQSVDALLGFGNFDHFPLAKERAAIALAKAMAAGILNEDKK
jgi:hypothetical protein